MTKLHELLAVEASLKNQAEATRRDLMGTFEKKRGHFSEVLVTFKSNVEGAEDKVESRLGLQTTVDKELDWIGDKLTAAIDAAYQIDLANTQAKADVVLSDGKVLLSNVPATTLLQLEKKLKDVQELIIAIPTLDPAKGFTADATKPDGVYKARDVEKPRTEKKFKFVVMTPATDKHPAQIEKMFVDEPVGTLVQQEWSSLITSNRKGAMLDRVEDVLRAVKQARSRANEQNVDVRANTIGKAILDYIL